MDIRMDPNLQKESESNGVLLSPLLHSKQTAHKPLSLWKNVLFAAGSTAPSIMDFMQGFYLNLFLLEIVKIHPYDVGILLIIKQLYDAVTDPLVGILSDNTKSRWGRRKPWIVIAIIPAVITFLLSWYNLPTPNDTDEYTKEWEDGSTILSEGLTHQASTAGRGTTWYWVKLAYFLAVFLFYSSFKTCLYVPYNSLIPDLAPLYHERTRVVLGLQVAGYLSGLAVTTLQSEMIKLTQEDYSWAFFYNALLFSPLLLVLTLLGVWVVQERPVKEEKKEEKEQEDKKKKEEATAFEITEAKDAESEKQFSLEKSEEENKEEDDEILLTASHNPTFANMKDYEMPSAISKHTTGPPSLRIGQMFRTVGQALTCPPFVLVSLIILLSSMTASFFQLNFFLYMLYVYNDMAAAGLLLLVLQLCTIPGFFFWAWFSRRINGKILTYQVGCALWILLLILQFFYPPTAWSSSNTDDNNSSSSGLRGKWILYLLLGLRGFCSGVSLLPMAVLPDVVAIFEKRTGRRSEGLLYSVGFLLKKSSTALATALSSLALGLAGYAPDTSPLDSPPAVGWTFRGLVCLAPVGFLLGSMGAFVWYAWLVRGENVNLLVIEDVRDGKKEENSIVESGEGKARAELNREGEMAESLKHKDSGNERATAEEFQGSFV